jgi:hypothetical protein
MSIVDEKKAKKAVSILLWTPQLTVWEEMILADFTKEEANTKLVLRKVAQSMLMKVSLMTAHASVSVFTGMQINAVILDKDGVSQNNKAGCDKDESAE